MNTVMNPKRILAVLAAVTVTLMQVALFAHSTATYIA
jgi:hypothetical protein